MTSTPSTLGGRATGPLADLLKLRAFFRRDFLIAWSYRLGLAADAAAVLVGVFMFYLVSRMVNPSIMPVYEGERATYMEFVATGIVIGALVQIGVGRVTLALEGEQTRGTLESLLITPTSPSTVLLGSVVYDIFYVPLRTAVLLAVLAAAFGLGYEAGGLAPAGIFLLLFIPFVWGIGMISAALKLTFRRGSGVFTTFITLFTVGSGAYIPVHLLPEPARSMAPYNPIGVAAQGMRESLLVGGWSAFDVRMLAMPGLGALSLVGGIAVLRWAMRRERRRGSIGLY